MKMLKTAFWKKLCTPAKIYMAIAIIAAIVFLFNGIAIVAVVLKLIFAMIWTVILNWLCKKGYPTLSWFLVLLPYIIIALGAFEIYHISEEHRQLLRNIQLQGAYGQEAFTGGHYKHKKDNATNKIPPITSTSSTQSLPSRPSTSNPPINGNPSHINPIFNPKQPSQSYPMKENNPPRAKDKTQAPEGTGNLRGVRGGNPF